MKKIVFALCVCLALSPGFGFAQTIPNFDLSPHTFFKRSNSPDTGRRVFAWYMLGLGAFGGSSVPYEQQVVEYKAEIKEAQSIGLDGFGLEYLSMEANPSGSTQNRIAAAAMFEAAKEIGHFDLFFEFDEPGNSQAKFADYVDMIEQYSGDPNYYKYHGRPLVGAYAADAMARPSDGLPNDAVGPAEAVNWWRTNLIAPLSAAGIKIYFVPTTFAKFGNPSQEIAGWGDVAQGESVWQIQLSPIGGGLTTLENDANALHSAGQSWMSTLAIHYWVGSNNSVPGWFWMPGQTVPPAKPNGGYFEHAGGSGLDMQWQSVMKIQKPEWVIMLTWNDYGESYIQPVDDYKKYPNGTMPKVPLGWYKPQAGMDELNRYYIQWYKTGEQPRITTDGLFYSYRTHSGALLAAQDNRPPVTCGNGPIADDIFITTALTAPSELQVDSGGVVTKYDLPAGIRQEIVPFSTGNQKFTLSRNGKTIITSQGEPVVGSIQFYDYWPTTGYAEASPAQTK